MAFDSFTLQKRFSELGSEWSPRDKKFVCNALWQYYSECNPVQDARILQSEHALEPCFQELSFNAGNDLCALLAELCVAYQRAAFLDGLCFAFRMHDELT